MKTEGWKTYTDLLALRDWNLDKINPYAAKSEDYERRAKAIILNVKSQKNVEFLNSVIEQYKAIYTKLNNECKKTLVYNKGYFRITINGQYKYLRMENR